MLVGLAFAIMSRLEISLKPINLNKNELCSPADVLNETSVKDEKFYI